MIDEEEVMKRLSGRPPASPSEAAQQVALACQIIARFGHEDLTLGQRTWRPSCIPRHTSPALTAGP